MYNAELDIAEIDAAENGMLAASRVGVQFADLHQALCESLRARLDASLLYCLLCGNSEFREFLFARDDLGTTVIMPLLESMSRVDTVPEAHIYVALICLLIFSQDASWNEHLHTVKSMFQAEWLGPVAVEMSLGWRF